MAKILLVDDEESLLSVLSEILERENHQVNTAHNGERAIQLASREDYDLIVTDLIMPEKEGIETIMELRRSSPELRIIAMSGGGRWNANDYLKIAAQLGATLTLRKPFSRVEFLQAVDTAINSKNPGDPAQNHSFPHPP